MRDRIAEVNHFVRDGFHADLLDAVRTEWIEQTGKDAFSDWRVSIALDLDRPTGDRHIDRYLMLIRAVTDMVFGVFLSEAAPTRKYLEETQLLKQVEALEPQQFEASIVYLWQKFFADGARSGPADPSATIQDSA